MNKIVRTGLLIILGIAIFSCQKVNVDPLQQQVNPTLNDITPAIIHPPSCGDSLKVDLIADRTIHAGTISVINDASYIYVTYKTRNGWELKHTDLFVGQFANLPLNHEGNPVLNLFPYHSSHSRINTYTYRIPVSAIAFGSPGCIAAHARVVRRHSVGHHDEEEVEEETAWGNGTRINPVGQSWAMVFDYTCCLP